MSKDNEEKKPYLIYRVHGNIHDKGVAYAVKTAMGTFLKSHGFAGKVTGLDASSTEFEAFLEIFDNGKHDFNMNALMDHISVSGRLPSDRNIRPEIKITPISHDQSVQFITPAKNEDVAWQKTMEQYQQTIAGQEKTIGSLTQSLQERQKVISEKVQQINKLENIVRQETPMLMASPSEAIARSYLRQGLDLLLEVSADFSELIERRQKDNYVKAEGQIHSRIEFLNQSLGLNFKQISEAEAYVKRIGTYQSYTDMPEVSEALKLKKQINVDEQALAQIKKMGASEAMVELARQNIESSKSNFASLEKKAESLKQEFETGRKIREQLPELDKAYEVMSRVAANSKNRSNKGEFPILAYNSSETGLNILMPSISPHDPLESYIQKALMGLYGHTSSEIVVKQRPENLVAISLANGKRDLRDFSQPIEQLARDPVMNSLGAKLRVIYLFDNSPAYLE